MKANMIFKSILSLALAATIATFSSCSSDSKKAGESEHGDHDGHQHGTEAAAEQGNPQFKDQKVKSVFEHYIHLKNALVNSDSKEAQSGASMLQTALTEAGSEKGAELAGKIASATKIEDQRAQFDLLTSEVEGLIKSSKLSSGKIYKQYCPMAANNNGAYWLSSESDIKNPYYGDEMLECGEVKEEIK